MEYLIAAINDGIDFCNMERLCFVSVLDPTKPSITTLHCLKIFAITAIPRLSSPAIYLVAP